MLKFPLLFTFLFISQSILAQNNCRYCIDLKIPFSSMTTMIPIETASFQEIPIEPKNGGIIVRRGQLAEFDQNRCEIYFDMRDKLTNQRLSTTEKVLIPRGTLFKVDTQRNSGVPNTSYGSKWMSNFISEYLVQGSADITDSKGRSIRIYSNFTCIHILTGIHSDTKG